MSCPFSTESITQLKAFISLCESRPELLHIPDLAFFRSYIESLGGKLPAEPAPPPQWQQQQPETEQPQTPAPDISDQDIPNLDVESDPESELELDMEGCVEPDEIDTDSQKMGELNKETSEEDIDGAEQVKREALEALAEGDNEKAIQLFTSAIELNPNLAILYTKRGQAYLKSQKPNACIQDCTHALELNCDSAPAYKFRGRAYRLIGKWEEAAKDLRQACKIDFDEQADEWLKEVQPNAIKIEQHRLKAERKRADKEEQDKTERVRRAREAHARAAKAGPEPADVPEADAVPGGMDDFMKLMQDPEIMAAFQDPEVSAAFQDISSNPVNIMKYQSNPKVQALLTKLTSKLGGGAGGFPGFPMGAGSAGGGPDAGGIGAFPPQDDGLD